MTTTVKFEIKTYWGEKRFECEVDASLTYGQQLGFAVKAAIKARADLRGADLSGAVLRGADLRDAVLRGADLSGAVLRDAVLRGAVLRGADLSGADLSGADLRDAVLKDVKGGALAFAQTSIVPEAGTYIAFKKCYSPILRRDVIVKLSVPAEAKRSNASGRKCRAEFADILEVEECDFALSKHDRTTEYRAGKRVACHRWDENRWEECSGGIHHFITRIEAENY